MPRRAFTPAALKHLARSMCVLVAIALAVPASMAAAVQAPPHDTQRLASSALGEQRRINVYVPPAQPKGARMPALYMPDGGVDEDFPHVATAIDAAIRDGRMAPVILVGIENTQRRRDMTGPTTVDRDRAIAPVVGGSAAFRRFIATELMPWVEATYPVSTQRGIIGESLAALFILETLFESPALFDTWIALDPSLWWNGGRLAKDAPGWLGAHRGLKGRLYIAWTEPELIGPNVKLLEDALRKAAPKGLDWQVVARPELDHSTIYRTVAPDVLPKMYPPR